MQIGIILILMVAAYALTKMLKASVETSMLMAALVGGVAGAVVKTPPLTQLVRHLAEGSFTYLDVMLVFVTANQNDDTVELALNYSCLLYTSPSPRDRTRSRMPSSA